MANAVITHVQMQGNFTYSRVYKTSMYILLRSGHDYCFDDLSANHSFYLAFENSNCPDYITEKFWRTLSKPIIPIVMGGGNYLQEAPPHSYIDVSDFTSPQDLANYMKLLMTNRSQYEEYFAWKRQHFLYQKDAWCSLCEKLHDPNEPMKSYANVSEWYYNDENGNYLCTADFNTKILAKF